VDFLPKSEIVRIPGPKLCRCQVQAAARVLLVVAANAGQGDKAPDGLGKLLSIIRAGAIWRTALPETGGKEQKRGAADRQRESSTELGATNAVHPANP
jgi:hypothetical protein